MQTNISHASNQTNPRCMIKNISLPCSPPRHLGLSYLCLQPQPCLHLSSRISNTTLPFLPPLPSGASLCSQTFPVSSFLFVIQAPRCGRPLSRAGERASINGITRRLKPNPASARTNPPSSSSCVLPCESSSLIFTCGAALCLCLSVRLSVCQIFFLFFLSLLRVHAYCWITVI